MGLLDKISGLLGPKHTDVTVLVLGLDHSGKSALLRALRPPDAPAPPANAASVPDKFQNKISELLGPKHTDVKVLVLGLDHSGKLALLHALRPPEAPAPPANVTSVPDKFQSGGVMFSAWDVSGAARHRALWERHYRLTHAIIFVVDAADHLRLVVAREELELTLAHPDICSRRLPILVCANKSDAPHALPAAHVAAALGLERILDKPWHICATSAVSGAGLQDGISWLARQLRDSHTHHK